MSESGFAFVSWLRRGAATLIEPPADRLQPRVRLDVGLQFQGPENAARRLELYGPGEITGFDAREVTRTWPGKNVLDAETNSFAHIEFAQADLPWRYTPYPADTNREQGQQRHVLSFAEFKGKDLNGDGTPDPIVLPPRQQFSNDGGWLEWGQSPPPSTITDGRERQVVSIGNLARSSTLATIDFHKPAISAVLLVSGFLVDTGALEPTIFFDLYRGSTLVQSIERRIRNLIGPVSITRITAQDGGAMTRLVMRVGFPPPMDRNEMVNFRVDEISYLTAVDGIHDGPGRLRPWCVLVVLTPEQILDYQPAADPRLLPSVKTRLEWLPDLSQSWAWAHVQVSGRTSVTPAEALALFGTAPQLMLSRIICARRLQPGVAYRAFLVPAFERGRRAGLGQLMIDPFTGRPLPATVPAWERAAKNLDAEVSLPVYFEWQFKTADNVDFESLVRSMNKRPLPADVGARPIDASAPGAPLPPASTNLLWIEGALKSAAPVRPWDAGEQAAFLEAFTPLLNKPKALLNGQSPAEVASPMYGRWFAARDDVDPAQTEWLDTVNTDLRIRVAAGAGAEVVQTHEDKMLDGAWRQIEGLPEINEKLRFAQLGRAVAQRMRNRRLNGASDESLFALMAPLLGRLKENNRTIAALVAESPLRRGPFEPAFRRLLRRIRRRRRQSADPAALLDRINRGEVRAAWTPPLPHLMPMISAWTVPGPSPLDTPEEAAFREAAKVMLDEINAPRLPETPLVPLSFSAIRNRIRLSIDPASAITRGFQSRLRFAPGFVRAATDPLEPILSAPKFDNPMYEPLRELSEEWILPGVALFPANTISLAVVNQSFIEAYMLGLSHELARSLLAHGFPGDQRNTLFRQFWDPRGYFGPRTREELRDIHDVDQWGSNALGANSSRPPLASGGEPVVLLLRGHLLRQYPSAIVYASRATRNSGLREPLDPPDERHPVFRGRLGGDIAFFGFELTADEARGDANDEGWFFVLQEQPNEPRFGFEPGTAADPAPMTWRTLRWSHFGTANYARYVDLTAPVPDTSNVQKETPTEPTVAWHVADDTTSAQIAWISLRAPARVSVHASEMLP